MEGSPPTGGIDRPVDSGEGLPGVETDEEIGVFYRDETGRRYVVGAKRGNRFYVSDLFPDGVPPLLPPDGPEVAS